MILNVVIYNRHGRDSMKAMIGNRLSGNILFILCFQCSNFCKCHQFCTGQQRAKDEKVLLIEVNRGK